MSEHRCVSCGSTALNHWTSWNVTGEWTCDECTPPLVEDDEL